MSVHKISAVFVGPNSPLTALRCYFFFPQHFCTSVLQRAWILFRKVFDNIGGHRKSLVYCLEVCSDVTAAAQFCPPNLPRPGG